MDFCDLGTLTYLLESGSDRVGAVDFQVRPEVYVPRTGSATLDELAEAADRIETGQPVSPEMDIALMHGTSIGGARPKVLLSDGERHLIAKLSSRTDPHPVVKAEAAAMALAALLVERIDRTGVIGQRRMMVSAVTMLGLDSMQSSTPRTTTWRTLSAPDSSTRMRHCASCSRESFSTSASGTPTTMPATMRLSGTGSTCHWRQLMTYVHRCAQVALPTRGWRSARTAFDAANWPARCVRTPPTT